MAVLLPVEGSNTPTPPLVLSDKLTYPTSLHPSLSSILKLSINSKTSEPYLPLSKHELLLTPSRQSDVPHRVKLHNDPTVSPFMYSPPNPYLPQHADEYFRGLRKTEEEIIGQSLKEGKASGCPLSVIRMRNLRTTPTNPSSTTGESEAFLGENKNTTNNDNHVTDSEEEDVFIGVLQVYREDSFLEIAEGPEREAAISKNMSLPTGDPTIIYTWYFLLSPQYTGKGYMTLVLKELRDEWLVPVLGARVIEAQAFSDNPGSEGVHLKLGFKETGETELRMPEDRGGMLRMERCFRWEKA
ncbi:BZ3500_MvSof-1268-A1-R1_Chr4-3g07338 [Microbotryum saponariae]|uniref:BZ3500_MvSof-1268-A1-R1_Chr4-3g07338 protein n=1 Tax=Microbotryum saponariae TaxID=289078 RepID=A0A2X0LN94_9BASI|nr:BZ3500_MvSof-1268-A1-R1_Chr4-3g07338 [Microbotryum saponariae]SDA07001.1 BZ3501_MvSof-1269-A2-R1_Chr4-2g07047 [Microbotryum saponariae]